MDSFPFVSLLVLFLCAAIVPVSLSGHGRAGDTSAPSATGREYALIETTLGTFEIELLREDAPKTVANFVGLAESNYYDGVVVHRVAKGFVIQMGDPTGTGGGGRSIYGGPFADELNPAAESFRRGYVRGTVAMANRGPNTNTSQFFVILADQGRMPKKYTIFGKVSSGMDVVTRIGEVDIVPHSSPTDGRPVTDVVIKRVTIRKIQESAGKGAGE